MELQVSSNNDRVTKNDFLTLQYVSKIRERKPKLIVVCVVPCLHTGQREKTSAGFSQFQFHSSTTAAAETNPIKVKS